MKTLCSVLVLFIYTFTFLFQNGSSLYFTTSEIRIFANYFAEIMKNDGGFKSKVLYKATGNLDPDEIGIILYKITPNQNDLCPKLQIGETNGLVTIISTVSHINQIASASLLDSMYCYYTVTGTLDGKLGIRSVKTSNQSLILNWSPMNTIRCSTLSPERLCFSELEKIDIQVMENSKMDVLGSPLGYKSGTCKTEQVQYEIIHEKTSSISFSEPFYIQENIDAEVNVPFNLWIKSNLDRELKDAYKFWIRCNLLRNYKINATIRIPVQISVLDVNDNWPRTKQGTNRENVSISLKHEHNTFQPHQRLIQQYPKDLLILDPDTINVNHYKMGILNDEKNLINVTFKTIRVPPILNTTESTVLMPTIHLSENANEIIPWDGLYCIDVIFEDIQVPKTELTPFKLEYKVCIHWLHENSVQLVEEWKKLGNTQETSTEGSNPQFNTIVSHLSSNKDGQLVKKTNNEDEIGLSGCGTLCFSLVTIGGMAIIFIFIGTFLILLKSRLNEKNRNGRKELNLLSHIGINGIPNVETSSPDILTELEYVTPNPNSILLNNLQSIQYRSNTLYIESNDLTVDSKWEIPRSSLELEDVLGVGEFGRVFKGKLHSVPGRASTSFTQVAVKMLKDNQENTGKTCREEFLAEFSLLQQVEHQNVIKLIGVCTTPGGPLFLIMEYAELGSLRSFLRKCRKIDGNLDGIGENEFTGSTLPSTTSISDRNEEYHVSPQEILQFSWQISRGMAYLSDMKMVHRDLAARNVLLTRSKVCKISDFGLTRDIYIDEAYKKKSHGRVPVKWLAPESLADEVYTSKSDVWSFGILLWELATLGASPYPGIPSEELYTLLKAGYRMPQPKNCCFPLYSLMLQCWEADPTDRPNFRLLGIELGKLLEDGFNYLKLDAPFVSNPGYSYFRMSQDDDTEQFFPMTYEFVHPSKQEENELSTDKLIYTKNDA